LLLFGVIYLLIKRRLYFQPSSEFSTSVSNLPYYAFFSFYRMFVAYLLALIFSLIYGSVAALRKGADRLLLPVLDVLQSVPVLGFFPAAAFFFISLFHASRIGLELASIFLVFTSQAWNMTFGVYEALKTIPKDLWEVAKIYQIKRATAYRKIFLPACTSKLVYNSILSWAGGWYFLVATEIIAAGPVNYRLPGLGSYLVVSSMRGQWQQMLTGLVFLISIIVVMDIVVWRPLTVWSEKFRYQYAASAGAVHHSWLLGIFNRLRRSRFLKAGFLRFASILFLPVRLIVSLIANLISYQLTRTTVKKVTKFFQIAFSYLLWILLFAVVIWLVTVLAQVMAKPLPPQTSQIPLALLASTARLAVAYLISLIWTVPAAIFISRNKLASAILTPIFEIAASIPATALFPLIIVLVVQYTGSVNLAAILLVLTGMQWYLLFNLISGATSIPEDMWEVAKLMKLKGWKAWKRLILPAMLPSLITGSITAWGGGWNALIVAEYFAFKKQAFFAFGIGALLDKATYVSGDSQMVLLSLFSMVALIILINRFFWRPLYNLAVKRFKIEY
jgi:NitT/TauT family transport system permease protein